MSVSKQCPVEAVETSSCTRPIEKLTGIHKFKISGYSLDKDMYCGEFLKSTIFSVGGYDWCVHYYPGGRTTANNYISLHVFLKSNARFVKAQVRFAIVDQGGSAVPISKTMEVKTFQQTGSSLGWDTFAKKEELEPYIRDDCLIIDCTVTVFKVFAAEPTKPFVVPPSDVQRQLSHLLETGIGADVTFEVSGMKFSAHKCILAARSPVFSAQFFGPMKEKPGTTIKIEEMEPSVFKCLLHFIYYDSIPEFEATGESPAEQDTRLMAEQLLVAADRYGLERLKIICQKILYDSIDFSNLLSLMSLAERHSCIDLKKACLKFVVSTGKIGEVIETEEFEQLVKNDPSIWKELLLYKRG